MQNLILPIPKVLPLPIKTTKIQLLKDGNQIPIGTHMIDATKIQNPLFQMVNKSIFAAIDGLCLFPIFGRFCPTNQTNAPKSYNGEYAENTSLKSIIKPKIQILYKT